MECNKCKCRLYAAGSSNQEEPDAGSVAWACEGCSGLYCAECCCKPALGSKQDIAFLVDPQCPFCDSGQVHIANSRNIADWNFVWAKKDGKNSGCILFLGIGGIIITTVLLF